ncbi:unnamed protein product [Hermetia illucens]|uniref:Uncharacterized protein n=2 Tax=Hermetia illucens TaxID=343691 RepID=A0A7R8Z1R2_HERIL|nr:unnamed protein product [Hermetia illucens]
MHGLSNGLSIIATPIFDDAAITATYSYGVKLLVHKNNVFPSETTIEKLIPIHSEVLVRIRPTVITCSNQVRQLGVTERNCLFPEERRLRFFSEYDDENCIIECQILSIIERCECVPYYFIEVPNIPVCNFTKIPCLVDNFEHTIVRKESAEYRCECPPSCQNTIFDVQTNAIPLSITNFTIVDF